MSNTLNKIEHARIQRETGFPDPLIPPGKSQVSKTSLEILLQTPSPLEKHWDPGNPWVKLLLEGDPYVPLKIRC